jgi:hypothetical protein
MEETYDIQTEEELLEEMKTIILNLNELEEKPTAKKLWKLYCMETDTDEGNVHFESIFTSLYKEIERISRIKDNYDF